MRCALQGIRVIDNIKPMSIAWGSGSGRFLGQNGGRERKIEGREEKGGRERKIEEREEKGERRRERGEGREEKGEQRDR